MEPDRNPKTVATLVLILLALCFLTRAAWIIHVRKNTSNQEDAAITHDSFSYIRPAKSLLSRGAFWGDSFDAHPAYFRTPGYPAFLSVLFFLFGENYLAVQIVQVGISILTIFVIYRFCISFWSPFVALVAVCLCVLEPLQFYSPSVVMTECLYGLAVALIALFGARIFSSNTAGPSDYFVLGLLLAIATFIRPVTYYYPIILLLLLFLKIRNTRPESSAVRGTVLVILPIVLLIGGWQVRNYFVAGSWRYTGVEAFNIYEYRAAGVLAEMQGKKFRDVRVALDNQFGKPRAGEMIGDYYERMRAEGLKILEAHPKYVAIVTLQGFISEFFGVRYPVFDYLNLPKQRVVVWAAIASLLLFYVFTAIGAAASLKSKQRMGHVFVLSLLAYIIIVSAGPEANPRFRIPLMPVLCAYASAGIYGVLRSIQSKRQVGLKQRRSSGFGSLPDMEDPR